MNTAPYSFRGMIVLIYELQGGTAGKLVCRVWYFMFTEGSTGKFPLVQEIMNFKHNRCTGNKKKVLRQTVE